MLGRYFYFESNGSSANPGNHLAEVQIVDTEGVNRALGMGLLRYSAVNGSSSNATKVTDGNTSYSSYFDFGEGRQYVVIDLGDVYDISYIKVWRYYSDRRTYKDVFIKVSLDDVNYTTVFSSAVDGTYTETAEGKQIDILNVEHDVPEEPEEPEEPSAPIFDMPLKDSLEYTGESFTVSVSGSTDIVFEENAFSATTNSGITIALPTPLSTFTIFFRFKIYSNSVSINNYRRLIFGYGIFGVKFFGAEIAYADGKTTNKLVLSKTFTDALDDGNWHTCVIKKEGSIVTFTVDDTYTDTISTSYSLEQIRLSDQSYALNGLIKNVKVYDEIVDDFGDVEEPEAPEVDRLYYNGVLLPAIPADVLSAYPYAWIRKNDTTAYYDLIMSDNPFYWKSSAIYESGGNAGRPYYRIWQGDADRAMGWTDYGSYTYSSWTWSENRTVLWSNHDMPYNSATATVFYIRGSEPIEESEYVDQSGKKAYYNGVLLPAIPQGVLGGYPYAWIRRTPSTGVCELICFPNGAYYDGSSIWDKGPVHGPRYKTTIGANAENWEYVDCTYSAYGLSSSEVLWSNHDIPNGSATATDIYVYGSEPELELPEEPEEPDNPDNYTELEYIEATGTQYINTGYTATSKTTAEYKVNYTSIGNLGPHLLSGNKFYFPLIRDSSSFGRLLVYRGGNEFTSNAITGTTGVDYIFKGFFDDEIVINDISYGTVACGNTMIDTVPLHLMTYGYDPNNKLYLFKGKLYHCKIYEDGVPVRDFVPAKRKSDSVVGLYDKVNDVFYTNNGTGNFTGLPKIDGYTALEYIESSGTQYIDTGYYPNANTRVAADVYIRNVNDFAAIYGAIGNNRNFQCGLTVGTYIGDLLYPAWIVGYGGSTAATDITQPMDRGKQKIDHTGSTATITGPLDVCNCSLTVNSTFDGTSSYPLYIFAYNNNGAPTRLASFQLYSFKIYEGETIVRDLVPAQNNDGVIGLYDYVEGVFYTNSGSGAFTSSFSYIPPRLPKGYTELEYIESDGAQYIDTGFRATSHTRVYTEVLVKDGNVTTGMYGSFGPSCKYAYVYNPTNYFRMHYADGNASASLGGAGYKDYIDHTASSSYIHDNTFGYTISVVRPTFDNNNPYSMYVFTVNNEGTADASGPMRVYIFKAKDEGIMARCLVPAKRNVDGEIGMYDTINDVFYTNAGTGTFTAGPEIVYAFEAGITIINGIPAVITDGRVCLNGVICRITAGTAIVNGVVKRITFTT